MEQIQPQSGSRGQSEIQVDFKCEEKVMESMHEGSDNLKIVRQDTTVLDCAISPKQGTNHSIRTFSS